jgi:hypothetical protein
MKNLLLIFVLAFLFYLNNLGQETQTVKFGLNDSACIKIVVGNIVDPIYIKSKFCSSVPYRGCDIRGIDINMPGTHYITYKTSKPGMVYFY